MTIQPTVIELGPGVHEAIDFSEGVKGLILRGSGRTGPNATIVKGFKARGLWYSHISDLSFQPDVATDVVVDIDKGTFGTQANTFSNVFFNGQGRFDGELSNYCLTMNKISTNSGQGSENLFLNCHFSGSKKACVYIAGYNALNNQFIGGNCQLYERCGIELLFGSMHIFGMGFQSTFGIKQIENDGWDIKCDSGGVYDGISINGCRTESLRFYKGNGAQPPMITNCNQRAAIINWSENNMYNINTTVLHEANLYKCLRTHISVNTDDLNNTSLWKYIDFNVVESLAGTTINNNWQCGNVMIFHDTQKPVEQVVATKSGLTIYKMQPHITDITVDATNGPVEIRLCSPGIVPHGKEVKVIRLDETSNTVTVKELYFNNKNVHSINLTSSPCCLTFQAAGGGSIARRWYNITPTGSRFVN